MSNTKFRFALLAGAVALLTVPALAQDEDVQVNGPRYRVEHNGSHLTTPPEKVSLSSAVAYDDLNLRSRAGARALHARVRERAAEVCAQLADYYPVHQLPGTNCYKSHAGWRASRELRDL